MTATFVNSFILFFVTIDTVGNLPFFLSLTEGAKIKKRNQIALQSIIIAFFIMITFAYLGRYLLETIHVSLDSLKIAGGVILMILAIDILFEKRKTRREKRVEEALDEKNFEDIVVFPIAFPFIAGPSALTTIILLIGNYTNFPEFQIPVILALIVAALIVSLDSNDWSKFYYKIYTPTSLACYRKGYGVYSGCASNTIYYRRD